MTWDHFFRIFFWVSDNLLLTDKREFFPSSYIMALTCFVFDQMMAVPALLLTEEAENSIFFNVFVLSTLSLTFEVSIIAITPSKRFSISSQFSFSFKLIQKKQLKPTRYTNTHICSIGNHWNKSTGLFDSGSKINICNYKSF